MSFSHKPMAAKLLAPIFILLTLVPIGAEGLTVPKLDLYTHGVWENSSLSLQTYGDIELSIEGGYKLGGDLGLRLQEDNLEDLDPTTNPGNLIFKNAGVTIFEIFNLPIDISYFVGEGDILCEGTTFRKLFGTLNFATKYSGYLYFPDETLYEGITRIDGTGLKVSTDLGLANMKLQLYTYQDNTLGVGDYTSILRGLYDGEKLKFEAFLGGSYPESTYGFYSGGFMFYYKPSEVGEFFTQIGIPSYDPADGAFDVNLFYFLFEPRINFGIFSINMTYLLRPATYLNTATNEEGNMDLNFNFMVGQPEVSPLSGGLEATMKLNTNAASDPDSNFFNITVSPYFGAITSGVVWDFKLKVNIIKNTNVPMFEGFVGVKAEL